MVRSGLMDPETAIRERGENPDTVLAAWKRWADKVDEAGLIFDCDPRHVTQVGNATQNGATVPPKPPTPPAKKG
jgi:capsid protein